MEEIELELANLDFAQQNGEAFNLMLKQKNGNRFLPVVIGVYEAKTIILQVNKHFFQVLIVFPFLIRNTFYYWFLYFHSSAPFRQAYARPKTKMTKKNRMPASP